MQASNGIALYGGTFDPIHNGHIAVAESLLTLFELEQVLFIPAYVAPHKRGVAVTRPLHRYTMLALATQHDSRLRISTVEMDSPERPYTVETVARMRSALPPEMRLYFVMGADSWREISTWREWERLVSSVDCIVVTRPGYDPGDGQITPQVRERIIDLRGAGDVSHRVKDARGVHVYITDAAWMDVSATAIRRAAGEGQVDEYRRLVPPAVADYIAKYRLYGKRHGTEFDDQGTGSSS